MAYSDPRKNAKFVDDNHLRPRDNSGGSIPTPGMNLRHSTDFGQSGKNAQGGEADDGILGSTAPADDDEIRYPKGR
jgi:hypothetical protein